MNRAGAIIILMLPLIGINGACGVNSETPNGSPPPPNGACCLADESCIATNADDCSTISGTFNEAQDCAQVQCTTPPPPSGACCVVDGSCRIADADECSTMGGTFNVAQACDQVACPAPGLTDLRELAHGLESVIREGLDSYIETVSIVGREYWNLNDVEPAYNGELLGKQGAALDANGLLTTRTFIARYKAVRHASSLIKATENADAGLTPEQENGLIGYAKTLQAYALLLVANHQFSNGILPPAALDDPDPSSSFLSYAESLQFLADLLDEAATRFTNAGPAFVFDLSSGFSGFTTPATFRQVNRALSARVRLYQGDKSGAISGIAGSCFNINGAMDTGPKHSYGIETRNPMHHQSDEDLFTVHPMFLTDADVGDARVAQKTRPNIPTPEFFVPVVVDGLVGDTQVRLFALNTEPFPIIRNEELILIYAEAQIGASVNESLAAINRVRTAAGLGNYLGATDDASLLIEVLKQRRHSFFGEGHRWIDLRRTGKISEIPIDRAGDEVHGEFPRPGLTTLLAL